MSKRTEDIDCPEGFRCIKIKPKVRKPPSDVVVRDKMGRPTVKVDKTRTKAPKKSKKIKLQITRPRRVRPQVIIQPVFVERNQPSDIRFSEMMRPTREFHQFEPRKNTFDASSYAGRLLFSEFERGFTSDIQRAQMPPEAQELQRQARQAQEVPQDVEEAEPLESKEPLRARTTTRTMPSSPSIGERMRERRQRERELRVENLNPPRNERQRQELNRELQFELQEGRLELHEELEQKRTPQEREELRLRKIGLQEGRLELHEDLQNLREGLVELSEEAKAPELTDEVKELMRLSDELSRKILEEEEPRLVEGSVVTSTQLEEPLQESQEKRLIDPEQGERKEFGEIIVPPRPAGRAIKLETQRARIIGQRIVVMEGVSDKAEAREKILNELRADGIIKDDMSSREKQKIRNIVSRTVRDLIDKRIRYTEVGNIRGRAV